MAVTSFYEADETRDDLEYGAQGGGVTIRFHALGSDDEAEVYAEAVAESPTTWLGFIRQNIGVQRDGPGKYTVAVRYGTTGLGGGDVPTGTSSPTAPTSPASDSAALGAGYSFQTTGATVHLTQSLETISSTRAGGGDAPDFKQAIGVSKSGVAGVDVPAPSLKWTRTVARASVTRAYVRTLRNLTGKVNDDTFYGSAAGTVRYLGADGNWTGEVWSITHHFEENENQSSIDVSADITVASKDGWDYLWVFYEKDESEDSVGETPVAAYVERVSERGNFALIEIGTTGGG